MAIEIGQKIPDVKLKTVDGQDISTTELFRGKKVVLFGVPGAFSPTCSDYHLPGFIDHADDIRAKGVDTIACVGVNDHFVMGAWAKARETGDKILMLADGNGDLARAMGLESDSRPWGMGFRSRRYAAVIEDGVIKDLKVDQPGRLEASAAEEVLKRL
jgi:glutaredoxin/glutathione-dependent peroxiredoxin